MASGPTLNEGGQYEPGDTPGWEVLVTRMSTVEPLLSAENCDFSYDAHNTCEA
jgi:hypothetical protein